MRRMRGVIAASSAAEHRGGRKQERAGKKHGGGAEAKEEEAFSSQISATDRKDHVQPSLACARGGKEPPRAPFEPEQSLTCSRSKPLPGETLEGTRSGEKGGYGYFTPVLVREPR